MAIRLNPDSIGITAGAFVELFTKLVRGQSPARFLEVLCGLMYATQRVRRVLELTGVLTAEELSETDRLLANAAGSDMGEQAKGLQEILQRIKGEKE